MIFVTSLPGVGARKVEAPVVALFCFWSVFDREQSRSL